MTMFDFAALLALILSAGALILAWTTDTRRQADEEAAEEEAQDVFEYFEDRIDALETALGQKFAGVDTELEDIQIELDDHDKSLNGAAAEMVETQLLLVAHTDYIRAVHNLAKAVAERQTEQIHFPWEFKI